MSPKDFMTIDGIPVEINGEKNLLELIRKVGIELPTFCYHSDLSIYGACRMCVVENQWGAIEASCSTPPKAGMEIKTNTARLRKYRKNILELLLANHCRDCTTCKNSGQCKLQELAMRFNIEGVRFPMGDKKNQIDDSSPCITKDTGKCILCGDCVRVCNEVQRVGAIDFAHRGSEMTISTAFDMPLDQSGCVGCGQCAAVCPTGAILIKDDTQKVWDALSDPNCKVTAQIAPAVRVAVGQQLNMKDGENSMGKIVAALKRIGFEEVYDTATGADLTVLEESNEFLRRLEEGQHDMPLFTSCCPAWIRFCEKRYPELLKDVSTCRSPMEMFAGIIKEHGKTTRRKQVHVAIMPCTAKKFEAARDEFKIDGQSIVDHVLTTQELIRMIQESGLIFDELEPEAIDSPFSSATGAGVIFGVTGGVTEAVLRRLSGDKSRTSLETIALKGVRGMDGVKETTVKVGEKELRIAVVSGLKNAEDLIKRIKAGDHYDFVEIMACPGGCVSGAGQPYVSSEKRTTRGKGLYASDKLSTIKRSEENPLIMGLYGGLLKGRVHELLHVHYKGEEE